MDHEKHVESLRINLNLASAVVSHILCHTCDYTWFGPNAIRDQGQLNLYLGRREYGYS